MGGGKGKVSQDVGYVQDAWQYAVELGTEHGCGVRLSMWPDSRRGVWQLQCQAIEVVDGKAVGVRYALKDSWPNSRYESLSGTLFRLVVELDKQLSFDALTGLPNRA